MAMLAAGAVVTAEEIWMPGKKLISIPKKPKKPYTTQIKISGLVPGDRAYACYLDELEWNDKFQIAVPKPIFNERVTDNYIVHRVSYTSDREVLVRVRNNGEYPIRSFEIPGTLNPKGLDIETIRKLDR